MREIKFRAWDIDHKQFINFGFADLNGMADFWGNHGVVESADFTDMFQQYTGLKDKNGKEIYEGDIVECEQMQGAGKFKGIVHFGVEERGYSNHLLYDARVYLDTRPFDEIKGLGGQFCCFHYNPEIIGNIYENPELLNSPKKE